MNIPEQLTIKTYDVEDYGYCGFNIQYLTKPTIWGLFDGKAKVYGDDPIINIVPRELFVHRGQYTYIGQDYGFFVNTKSYESSGKYSATNIVDVLIFDIIVDHDNFGMTYTIKPLYTYTYLYISYYIFYEYESIVFNNYNISLTSDIALTDAIIPWPESYGELRGDNHGLGYSQSYTEAKKNNDLYAIKDPGAGIVLENENKLNMYDNGYDPSLDNGYRLTQSYITYIGKGITDTPDLEMSKQWGYAGQTALGAAGIILPLATGGAGALYYIGIGISTISTGWTLYDWITYSNSPHETTWSLTQPANHITDDSRGSSYEQQKQWFTSRGIAPQLWKMDGKRLLTTLNDPLIFPSSFSDGFGNKKQGEITFTFNYTSFEPSEARIHYTSCLEIVQVGKSNCIKLGEAKFSSSLTIGTKQSKTIVMNEMQRIGYILKGGFDSFNFTPEYSSIYTFSTSLLYNGTIEVKKGNQIVAPEKSRTQTLKLEKGVEYTFNVRSNTNDKTSRFYVEILTLTMENTVNVDLDSSLITDANEILIKYRTSSTGIHDLSIMFDNILSGNTVYSSNIFRIYDENFNEIEKFPNTGYSATNIINVNSFNAHLEKSTTYYILIIYPNNISNIKLNISLLKNKVELDNNNSFEETKNSVIGDELYNIKIPYSGRYTIKIEANSSSTNMRLLVLKKYSLEYSMLSNILIYQGNGISQITAYFNRGDDIYFGYINSENTSGNINVRIYEEPLVIFNIMTDPNLIGVTLGTEVTINQKGYYGSTVAKGFTRCAYLSSDALYTSRLDYNWVSTNPDVATVSQYGTITGVNPGTTTIRVTDKYNQGHLATYIITVYIQEPGMVPEVRLSTDINEDPNLDGTEVRENNGFRGDNTIHVGFTRSICIVENGPTNIRQDYIWKSSDSSIATVDQYGIVRGYKPGTVTITCINKANPSYTGSITIVII